MDQPQPQPQQPGQVVLNTETVIETLHSMLAEKDQHIVILRSQLTEANRANAQLAAELAQARAVFDSVIVDPSPAPEG